MKLKKAMTPADHFAAAKEIITSNDYKVFTPRWRYFRQKLQLIAAKSYRGKKLFLLQLKNSELVVRGLSPNYGDRVIVNKIERELKISIIWGEPLPCQTDKSWEDAAPLYIAPREQAEFDLFIKK